MYFPWDSMIFFFFKVLFHIEDIHRDHPWSFFFFSFFFIDNQFHIQKIVFFQLRNDSYIYKKFNLYNKW